MISRFVLHLLPLALLLSAAGCGPTERAARPEEIALPTTPVAVAGRVNAAILSRKREHLRNLAMYLRLRAEGRLLLEALREHPEKLP